MQNRKHKLHDLYEALRHPSVDRVSRVVMVVHIVYYTIATVGIGGTLYYFTSGACAVALAVELILKGK